MSRITYTVITYTVIAGTDEMFADAYSCATEREARETALRLCSETDVPVYVEFYRMNDGQRGYLDRNGNYEITGHNWND